MPISTPPARPVIIAPVATSIAAMKGHRRVLILTAPSQTDPALQDERQTLVPWRAQAALRDVSIVEVVGDHVGGTTDDAATLRRTWYLPTDRFTAILIGKDGHEAFRSETPVSAADLTRTIDAMPMRRAGLR